MTLAEKNQKLKWLINKVNNSEISSIKSTVGEMIRLLNDPNSSAKNLKDIIEVDPPLSARILHRANSAYYAAPKKFTEIQQAIVWVGFNEVKELALNQKVCEIFEKAEIIEGYSRQLLWRNSVATALFGKYIFRREFRLPGENTYAAGLLHNIGIIIEDQFLHDDFYESLKYSRKHQKSLVFTEDTVIGLNHAEIGEALSTNWTFPPELTMTIGRHHDPAGKYTPDLKKLIMTLYISDACCKQRGLGYSDVEYTDDHLFDDCLAALQIEPIALDYISETVEQDLVKMESSGWL